MLPLRRWTRNCGPVQGTAGTGAHKYPQAYRGGGTFYSGCDPPRRAAALRNK